MRVVLCLSFSVSISAAAVSPVWAAPILANSATLSGGVFIDFEGQAEGDATNLYAGLGVTFYNGGGVPVIDNSPFSLSYTSNSGAGVLAPSAPPAQLGMEFSSGQSAVEFFFSDTSVLGNYTISAFGSGGGLLESFVVSAATAGTSPLFLGFSRPAADIFEVRITPADQFDAFAIDDLRFVADATAVPEPATMMLLASGLAAVAVRRRARRRV